MISFTLLTFAAVFLNIKAVVSTTCYDFSAPDTTAAWQVNSTTKNNLQNLRQSFCNASWSNCGNIDNTGSGNATANCWGQSSDDSSMQVIMYGPNPTDSNACWDNMQHIIDDCLSQDSTSGNGLSSYGLTGLWSSGSNVWIMTRVGNRKWGMPNPQNNNQLPII